jgi:hypothetical protein
MLGLSLKKVGTDFKDWVKELPAKIRDGLKWLLDTIRSFLNPKDSKKGLIDWSETLGGWWKEIKEAWTANWPEISDFAGSIWKDFSTLFKPLGPIIKNAWNTYVQPIIDEFWKGFTDPAAVGDESSLAAKAGRWIKAVVTKISDYVSSSLGILVDNAILVIETKLFKSTGMTGLIARRFINEEDLNALGSSIKQQEFIRDHLDELHAAQSEKEKDTRFWGVEARKAALAGADLLNPDQSSEVLNALRTISQNILDQTSVTKNVVKAVEESNSSGVAPFEDLQTASLLGPGANAVP